MSAPRYVWSYDKRARVDVRQCRAIIAPSDHGPNGATLRVLAVNHHDGEAATLAWFATREDAQRYVQGVFR